MNPFRFGGLADPAVRAERAQPDAPDRPDGDRSARGRGHRAAHGDARAQAPARARRAPGDAIVLPDRAVGRDETARGDEFLSSILDPSLLIADEVTSALDVSTQRAVSELLVEFRNRGFVKSMIVITHDLSVLYQIARTRSSSCTPASSPKASADTVVGSPSHPYTQLLLSSLPEVGIRYAEQRLGRIPARPPSFRSTRPPAAASGRGARSRSRSASRSRRSSSSSRSTPPPAGGRSPDAEARHLLQDLSCGRLRRLRSSWPSATSASRSRRARSSP